MKRLNHAARVSFPAIFLLARGRRGLFSRPRAGFSIVELMSVLAAMSVMVALAMPALSGVQRAGAVNLAAYEIAGTLEQARAYAMANNTYVFVGIAEDPAATGSGSAPAQLLVATMGSKDGTRSLGGSGANLTPLSRLLRISGIRLEDSLPNPQAGATPGGLSRPDVAAAYRLGNTASTTDASGTFSWKPGAALPAVTFSKVILFDPRGTPAIPSEAASMALPKYLEISLVPSLGYTASGSVPNCAALVLDGVTGSVRIYRP
ncbi:MAG: Tfp pilus assembly protein FimT/FimU [Candidatus Methylacidiphilales bacterium]|nr:hypothetical protein [Candidatus Methylacidiphilales bacterium]